MSQVRGAAAQPGGHESWHPFPPAVLALLTHLPRAMGASRPGFQCAKRQGHPGTRGLEWGPGLLTSRKSPQTLGVLPPAVHLMRKRRAWLLEGPSGELLAEPGPEHSACGLHLNIPILSSWVYVMVKDK